MQACKSEHSKKVRYLIAGRSEKKGGSTMTRILVVDDDQAIQEMLGMMLEGCGYNVLHATNGLEALEVLRTTPDRLVVLLDLHMPKIDGRGVLHAVAEDERLSTQHSYILLSATQDLSPYEPDPTLPPVPVVPKPFEMDDLLDTVDKVAQHIASPVGGSYHDLT